MTCDRIDLWFWYSTYPTCDKNYRLILNKGVVIIKAVLIFFISHLRWAIFPFLPFLFALANSIILIHRKQFENSLVIEQKGESQSKCYKKKKARQIFRKTNISSNTHTCVCVSGGTKCLLFGKFGVLFFL